MSASYWRMPSQKDHCVSVSMFILIVPASIAYWMSSRLEPEPPWKTKYTGFLSSPPSFSEMYFCVLWRIWGSSLTCGAVCCVEWWALREMS